MLLAYLAVGLLLILIISTLALASGNEYSIKVYKGWNLVYGFSNLEQLNDQLLRPENIKAIYAFMPTTQEYVMMYPKRDVQKVEQMAYGQLMQTAFWVYSDITIETEYWQEYRLIPFDERQLYAGWNFVGITPDMIGPVEVGLNQYKDLELKDLAGSCKIEKSYFFNPEGKNWFEIPLTEEFEMSEALSSGWVIKVSGNCKLGNDASGLSPPPQLPN